MIRKHFLVFAMDISECDYDGLTAETPIIFYLNHPGWWDPIVAMQVCQKYFPGRVFYAPIDQVAIEKYAVFKKLGFFGVALEHRSGSIAFLRQTSAILNAPNSSLWITPEGRFADPRDKNAEWMPGLAHLVAKHPQAVCIPMAIEYPFIDEVKPLMLCKLGPMVHGRDLVGVSKAECSVLLESKLRLTQESLAESVVTRSFNGFKVLVRTAQTPKSVYDWGRLLVCKVSGRPFELNHGKTFRSS
ncbi:MAG: lysophospholipid acyltransferase family protein [Planctomycetota bacterium]|nr:lysophospholipid acyltransferase family protein [Planctomycetota bacterium]